MPVTSTPSQTNARSFSSLSSICIEEGEAAPEDGAPIGRATVRIDLLPGGMILGR